MEKNAKIYVAGHTGLVGTTLVAALRSQGYNNLLLTDINNFDLRSQENVEEFMSSQRPEYLFLLAAKVGGIKANMSSPAEFLYDNIMIGANLIHASYKFKVKKMLYMGSSCAYPRECLQPIREESILTGAPEPTNEAYAISKITCLKLVEFYNRQYKTNYISVAPTNQYGKNDNFDAQTSHVIPALIRKFHEAKIDNLSSVTIWGAGKARREFMYVEDLCDACIFLMNKYDRPEIVNIGTGQDISIAELVYLVRDIVGYKGKVIFDASRPEGAPRKLLDTSRLNKLGWKPMVKLADGIKITYEWYCQNKADG